VILSEQITDSVSRYDLSQTRVVFASHPCSTLFVRPPTRCTGAGFVKSAVFDPMCGSGEDLGMTKSFVEACNERFGSMRWVIEEEAPWTGALAFRRLY
jgi:hypothetical protein